MNHDVTSYGMLLLLDVGIYISTKKKKKIQQTFNFHQIVLQVIIISIINKERLSV